MPLSQPCTYLLVEGLHEVRSFFKSDAAHILLASLAAANAFLHYLKRCPLPQAKELAAAVLAGMILAVLVAASESEAPQMMLAGIKCNHIEATGYATKIALRNARRTQPG